jgi:uncharacterized protein (TIGR02284 family)
VWDDSLLSDGQLALQSLKLGTASRLTLGLGRIRADAVRISSQTDKIAGLGPGDGFQRAFMTWPSNCIGIRSEDSMADTVGLLNDLISSCLDSAEGFGKAAKDVHSDALRGLFTKCARRREEFADELASEVTRLGGQPAQRGHGGGVLHRGWVDIEQRIRPKDDPGFLADCEHGEAGTMMHYLHALDSELPSNLKNILERQRAAIEQTMERLRSLEIALQAG